MALKRKIQLNTSRLAFCWFSAFKDWIPTQTSSIEEFIKLHKNIENKYNSPSALIDEYINKNFRGIDATNKELQNLYKKLKYNPDPQLDRGQGWITKKLKDIIIKKVKVIKSN